MRILLQCNIPGTSDYRYGLLTTLQREHDVHHCSLNDFNCDIDKFKPQLYISVKQYLTPEAMLNFKKLGCKTIQLFPDDPDEFIKSQYLYSQYDYIFTNSMLAMKNHHAIGYPNFKTLSFAVDEKLLEGIKPQDKYRCDVMFIGGDNKKKYRYEYLNALKGLDVKVYGKFQKDVYGKQNQSLSDYKDFFSALMSAKIGIDFSVSGSGYMNVKTKSFEIPACQTLMLVNEFEEMKNYYEYDKEIIGFTTPEDLRKKCDYYLQDDDKIIGERLSIAQAGHKRFLKEHTWKKRLDFLFRECNIND
jgi:spore maturation protein CgeB